MSIIFKLAKFRNVVMLRMHDEKMCKKTSWELVQIICLYAYRGTYFPWFFFFLRETEFEGECSI